MNKVIVKELKEFLADLKGSEDRLIEIEASLNPDNCDAAINLGTCWLVVRPEPVEVKDE